MLMLALCRPRSFLHSVPSSQTRHLIALPREIPKYARRWNPALHEPHRPIAVWNKSQDLRPNAHEPGWHKDITNEQRDATDKEQNSLSVAVHRKSRNPKINHHVKRLQHVLDIISSSKGPNAHLRAPLWKAYTLARNLDPKLTAHISEGAWKLLWQMQSADYSDMDLRKARLAELDFDLRAAKAPQIAGQAIYYVERRFMAGKEQRAMDDWESVLHKFGSEPMYLDAGARLYGLAGHPDRAREIMDRLFEQHPSWDLSLMITVFRAHTSSDLKHHHATAKQMYLAIKDKFGSGATIETYDACFVGFLEARLVPCALEVFRDTIQAGLLRLTGYVTHVEEVLRRLHLLYALGTDISNMTRIAIDVMDILPRSYHNHIFGDWMKCAILDNAPQAAAQILDMMIQRGFQPEVFHFNLLLKGLLRTKDPQDISKAEDLAWKMVEEVKSRVSNDRSGPQSRARDIITRSIKVNTPDATLEMAVPAANVSTFALIMQHHAQKLQWEHVEYLGRQLTESQVEPNTAIMNVLIDNQCRQGNFAEAWQVYQASTGLIPSPTKLFPNGESIRLLWKMLRIAVADPAARDDPLLVTPRELLTETIRWWTSCRSRYDADQFLQGLAAKDHGAITSLILHCFSFKKDLAGSLIALQVLRHTFGIRPGAKAADILQRQTAWVDMEPQPDSVRRQFGATTSFAKNMAKARLLHRGMVQRRCEARNITKDTIGDYTEEYKGDLELDVLSEFIRLALLAAYGPDFVELMIDAARKSIGLPDLPTGDITADEINEALEPSLRRPNSFIRIR